MSETTAPAIAWRFMKFNALRNDRGVEGCEISADGQPLWMSKLDIERNIAEFGDHPELQKGLEAYRTPRLSRDSDFRPSTPLRFQ